MLHDDKITTIAEKDFQSKVLEASFQYAKGIILGTIVNSNVNVKRFAQIVLKDIANGNPSWLNGIAYFVLSTSDPIDLTSTQAQVSTEVNTVFPYYAKAVYGDIS